MGENRSHGNPCDVQRFKLSIAGASGSTGVFKSVKNPWQKDMLVLPSSVLRITTQSGAASTLDIGKAADGTTSNDTLFDGLSGAAAGTFEAAANGGSNGGKAIVLLANDYLNISEASGNVNALVADLHLLAVPL